MRAWPSGQGVVRLTCEPAPLGTLVTMVEDAAEGPATLVPKPVRDLGLHWRNTEALRRLAILAENGARSASRPVA